MLNKTSLTAFLTALLLGSGCVIVNPNDRRDPGDVTFAWSFNGETCAQSPEVAQVRVTIPGELLENDGYYGCSNGGYEGITLHDFVGGSYDYTVEALSNTGAVLYRAVGSFVIDGNVIEYVDLLPKDGPTSYAYLSWKFKANWASSAPNCAQAEVDYIDVYFDDDAEPVRYTCASGFGTASERSRLLEPGTHDISIYAVKGTTYDVAELHTTITTTAYSPADHTFTLDWIIGGASIKWQLTDTGVLRTCAQAGVTKVYVNFYHFADQVDPEEYWVYAQDLEYDCVTAKVLFNHLRPGDYSVWVEGVGTGGANYMSADPGVTTATEVTVLAGAFVTDTSPSKTIEAKRQ